MQTANKTLLLAFAVGLTLLVAWFIRGSLFLIYLSIVFAVVLSPAVDRVHRMSFLKWHPSRGMAILLIIIGVTALITIFLALTLPPVIADIQQLARQLPQKLRELRDKLQSVSFLRGFDLQSFEKYATSALPGITGFVGNVAQLLGSIFGVIVLTSYLILDGNSVLDWAMSLFEAETAGRLRRTLVEAAGRMRKWIVGQAMLMLVLGSASAIVFAALGLRYFYLLAVFAGLSNIIPMLGPILTVVLAGLVAAIDSPGKLIGVLVFYMAYQQVENAYLTPRIMKAQVHLPSTSVLAALLIGGELAGVAGALVSVPSAVLVSALVNEYLVKSRAGN